jgi:hypothetical protein
VDEYRELARKVGGRPFSVRIAAAERHGEPGNGAATEPRGPAPDEEKRQQAVEQATREPAVQEVLDLFNGKVVDVRVRQQQ